jgi:hypothetical protein
LGVTFIANSVHTAASFASNSLLNDVESTVSDYVQVRLEALEEKVLLLLFFSIIFIFTLYFSFYHYKILKIQLLNCVEKNMKSEYVDLALGKRDLQMQKAQMAYFYGMK